MIDTASSDPITLDGSCHCGAVKFKATLTEGFDSARRCTCSICRMRGAVAVTSTPADFHIIQGEDKLATYLCRIQVRSEKFPQFDGAWFRAFDYKRWDYWASNADMGWGVWSIEAGWGQAWIAATLALREKQTTMWEFTAGSKVADQLASVRAQMSANDGQPLGQRP